MRFRVGVVLGFAAGYYFGARAGRERYEQLRQGITRVRESRPLEKARAVVELGMERVRSEPVLDVTAVMVEEMAST
jgi:hypothetical protein